MGRLYVNVFTADPTCKYFIGIMCKCVRWSLDQPRGGSGGTAGAQRGCTGGTAGVQRGRFGEVAGAQRGSRGGGAAPGPPCGHLCGTLIILLLEPCSEVAIMEICANVSGT